MNAMEGESQCKAKDDADDLAQIAETEPSLPAVTRDLLVRGGTDHAKPMSNPLIVYQL